MDVADDYLPLLRGTLGGDKACAEALADLARRRLRTYVGRITLCEHLTEDVLQETMIEMFKFLGKLEKADRFWPWLFRMAGNNARDAVDHRRRDRQAPVESAGPAPEDGAADGLERLISDELRQTVSAAMAALRPEHRQVISLRCYEQLPYSEIAGILGRSEFAARMLFMRAKKSLARQLARRGMGKASLVLALGLFGRMTAGTKAAGEQVCITAAGLKVGWGVSLAGALTSKSAVVAALAGMILAGPIVVGSLDRGGPLADSLDVPGAVRAARAEYAVADHAWYFLPKGPAGPVMLRLTDYPCWCGNRCAWLSNEQGTYQYHAGRRAAVIENRCFFNPDGSVLRLPTDEPDFLAFLERMDGRVSTGPGVLGDGDNALIISRRTQDGHYAHSVRHYNALMEEPFRSNWPADTMIIDERDAMHRRGWTFFTIRGRIESRQVVGHGRIPFVFAQAGSRYPWLSLEFGDDLRVEDTPTGSRVLGASGQVMAVFPGGRFFAGLSRPWMGLHTIDTVRRDAASMGIAFETDYDARRPLAHVTVRDDLICLVYTIDMDNDLLREIAVSRIGGRELGRLRLSYADEIEPPVADLLPPVVNAQPASSPRTGNGMTWLLETVAAWAADPVSAK